jgi:pilus assembly protein CpaB
MRSVFTLVLVAGLGLAGTAAYMVRGQLQAQSVQIARTRAEFVPTVEVWAVTRQVAYGERLAREDVEAIRYVEAQLPEGAFRTEEELFPQGPEEMRTVLRQMEPGEPVLAVKVTEPGGDAGITSRLTPGMRAFTIAVDVASGVSGFLRPGNRVDVYWSGQVEEGGLSAREVTQLIEQGLRLVAIDQTTDDNLSEVAIAQTVTVEVTPQQVAKLAQAQATGSLSLSLVGQADDGVAEAVEVDQRSLLGLEDAPVEVVEAAPSAPQVCTVRTRRGGEVVETPVACPAGG